MGPLPRPSQSHKHSQLCASSRPIIVNSGTRPPHHEFLSPLPNMHFALDKLSMLRWSFKATDCLRESCPAWSICWRATSTSSCKPVTLDPTRTNCIIPTRISRSDLFPDQPILKQKAYYYDGTQYMNTTHLNLFTASPARRFGV